MSGRIADFQERGCDVLGISTDDVETHVRWLTTSPQDGGLGPIGFSLAADPDGDVCRQYGVFVQQQFIALRGLFIIDPNGVLQYQVVHSLSVGRSSEEVLRVLDALQSGGLCPGERQIDGPNIDVASHLAPGRVLGPYQIEAELGRGSFGTVFRAHDRLLDRTVALKILRREDGGSIESLLSEARAAAALNHPNLCTIHTVDTSNGAAMIVMEFVEGQSLAKILKQGPLPTERALEFGRQIAEGMAHAHDAGIIHGDLKPGNLIVTPEEKIKIMDFGLARRQLPEHDADDTLPWSLESSSGLSGTLGYLAPESVRGEPPTTATDAFALGMVIYEMLTGEPAVSATNLLDALRRIEEFDATELIQSLPEKIQAPMLKTLSQSPGERLTMGQLAEQMNRLRLDGRVVRG